MDIAKVKAAVGNVRAEIGKVYDATVEAGKKNPIELNGLQLLGKALLKLDQVEERLDGAVARTQPKPKGEKANGKAAKK